MLDSNPANRPPAHGLWERFQEVSLEICADCDPRHPDVWRSHDMIDLDLTPPMTFRKAIEVEPAPLLNHSGIVHGDSRDALAGYSTRIVDEVSDNDEDNIIDRNAGSGLEQKEKVYWRKSFGDTQESSPVKRFDHTQVNDSEKTEIPPETAQSQRASPKSFSGFDLLRENAEASLSPPPPKLPVVNHLPPLEAPVLMIEPTQLSGAATALTKTERTTYRTSCPFRASTLAQAFLL
jgi:hypothetical protein